MEKTVAHPIVAAVALLFVMAGGIASTIKILDMIDELNEKLPDKKSFDYLGWYLVQIQKVLARI
jgi:hypothetical protein